MKNAFILTIIALTIAACSPKTGSAVKAPDVKGIGIDLVKKSFQGLVAATNAGDVSKMLDFTYPKLFDVQPREQMEGMMGQMAMMGISQKLKNMDISNLSNFVKDGTMQFAKAKLKGTAAVNVTESAMIDPMMMQMKSIYGEDKLTKTAEGVDVAVDDDLYIIQDTETKKMYFLQADPQVSAMIPQLLPAGVFDQLNQ